MRRLPDGNENERGVPPEVTAETGQGFDLDAGMEDLLGEPERSEEEERDLENADLYIYSGEPKPGDPGFESFSEWWGGLSEQRRKELDQDRSFIAESREVVDNSRIRENLEASAGELFGGKLPDRLDRKVDGRYALGLNQLLASSLEEAETLLAGEGGLPMGNYNPEQRLLFIDESIADTDPDYTGRALVSGYYGTSKIGRFVFAFPTQESELSPAREVISQNEDTLPADFYLPKVDADGSRVDDLINPRYCAGFIDNEGQFHENADFMEKARFSTADDQLF